MKLQNMKLARKWREYAGPKDERLEAENAKIYKLGFMLLSFGMLTFLVYQIMAQQVAWVHDGAGEAFRLFANPVDAVMYAWLFIVMTVCAVLQTRKGYVDTNRFGQTEHIPVGYFLLSYDSTNDSTLTATVLPGDDFAFEIRRSCRYIYRYKTGSKDSKKAPAEAGAQG